MSVNQIHLICVACDNCKNDCSHYLHNYKITFVKCNRNTTEMGQESSFNKINDLNYPAILNSAKACNAFVSTYDSILITLVSKTYNPMFMCIAMI